MDIEECGMCGRSVDDEGLSLMMFEILEGVNACSSCCADSRICYDYLGRRLDVM
jgi:hypothetical protein